MTKVEYEALLKRIQGKLNETKKGEDKRFELPPVDIMWEGQKTFFRNFLDFSKILRRDPEKILQYLSKEFAVPAERMAKKPYLLEKGIQKTLHAYFRYISKIM